MKKKPFNKNEMVYHKNITISCKNTITGLSNHNPKRKNKSSNFIAQTVSYKKNHTGFDSLVNGSSEFKVMRLINTSKHEKKINQISLNRNRNGISREKTQTDYSIKYGTSGTLETMSHTKTPSFDLRHIKCDAKFHFRTNEKEMLSITKSKENIIDQPTKSLTKKIATLKAKTRIKSEDNEKKFVLQKVNDQQMQRNHNIICNKSHTNPVTPLKIQSKRKISTIYNVKAPKNCLIITRNLEKEREEHEADTIDEGVVRVNTVYSPTNIRSFQDLLTKKKETSSDSTKNIQTELEVLKVNLINKENNTLLSEFKSRNLHGLMGDGSDCDKTKFSMNLQMNTVQSGNSLTRMKTELKSSVKMTQIDEDSMLLELQEFKEDDSSRYKFEIPLKYLHGKNVRLVNEEIKKGKLVRYYDNSMLEIVSKNKNVAKLFPDGYSITFYPNKDIKQIFPDGRTYLLYYKNKSIEFSMPKGKFLAYKFTNGQFEKHYFDGRKYIKFSDGSIKIIRPNGEELNQFLDNSIQRKDKCGNITLFKQ